MAEIILHHYPQSPVAEKARVALGIKGLAWDSVIIPRVPPKPDLMPLTGGYRRTPVMQIGADIYCDSQCILRELERRHPEPSLIPGQSAGLVWGVSRWTDGPLLDLAVRVVLGAQAEDLPADFAADRGRLYLGPIGTSRRPRPTCRTCWPSSAASSTGSISAWRPAGASCWASSRPCPTC